MRDSVPVPTGVLEEILDIGRTYGVKACRSVCAISAFRSPVLDSDFRRLGASRLSCRGAPDAVGQGL